MEKKKSNPQTQRKAPEKVPNPNSPSAKAKAKAKAKAAKEDARAKKKAEEQHAKEKRNADKLAAKANAEAEKAAAQAGREQKKEAARKEKEKQAQKVKEQKAADAADAEKTVETCVRKLTSVSKKADKSQFEKGQILYQTIFGSDAARVKSQNPMKKGATLRKIAERPEINESKSQLQRLVQVAIQTDELAAVPMLGQLSFSHQDALLAVKDDDEKKQRESKAKWIDVIVAENLSVKKFREKLKGEQPREEPDHVKPYKLVSEKCTKWNAESINDLSDSDRLAVIDLIDAMSVSLVELKKELTTSTMPLAPAKNEDLSEKEARCA